MNTKKSSMKQYLIIAAVVAVAGIAYFYFNGSSAPSSETLQSQNVAEQEVGNRVLSLLNQIRSLKIDTSIFKDPSYKTLRDYSIAIPPENVWRANPFAPIPGMPTATGSGGARH